MSPISLHWTDPEPSRPAYDVLVRLIALTDDAFEAGDLSPYWMSPVSDGSWTWTADLPADLRTTYQLCPVRDRPARGEHPDDERWQQILSTGLPDPAAARQLPAGTVWGNPGPASVLSLPAALPQPWLEPRLTVAPGELTRVEVGNSVIQVWQPVAQPLEQLPVVISFDGGSWVRTGVPTTFANLVADGAAPPFVGVLIESIHNSAERGPTRIRSLTHPDQFADFVLAELLPHLRRTIAIDRTVLAGQSLGGLAAAYVAALAPDQIDWVLGQSAALWWPGDEDGGLSGAAVIAAYDDPALSAVRFFLEVGTEEDDLRRANHDFHKVLRANGNPVTFREFRGGHDHACWQGGLADGIVAALNHDQE